MDLTPQEASRRAEATEKLLDEMRAGGGHRGAKGWWDQSYVRLGGRTPTEALTAGDEDQVRALVQRWYEESEVGAERLRQNPALVKMIRTKGESRTA
jgi:alkanesulfonate monooxygenase SsuD/methylene tetrahydromethanopterin reductase-like flavin-dependent oxidoreductase (luciferase family)